MGALDSTNKETCERIVNEANTYLAAQVGLATAADQRAAVLAGAFTLVGAALMAGLVVVATVAPAFNIAPIFISGGAYLFAASLCVAAIMPTGIWLPGNQPKNWYEDLRLGRTLGLILRDEARNLQERIDKNRVVVTHNANLFKGGVFFGILAPFAGLITWAICR